MKLFFFAVIILGFSKSFSQISTNEGLVAYYPFNGSAKDVSGNNNNPSFNNEINGDNGTIKPINATKTKGSNFLPEERINTLIQQIEVLHDSIEILFYHNGTIDGDSITVQFNNKIITRHLLLTSTGKSFYIKIEPSPASNELIMFAENLGSIPPNTALMIIYDGKKRHEININSSKTYNGVVSFVLKK